MKTTVKWASALALGAAAWKICRDRKYPLAKGCPPMNLFVVPGGALSPGMAALGNRVLARMPLPPVMPGLRRSRQTVQVPGGQEVPLTLYEPEGAVGKLPCLVYFHGGGFCFADAGYIHQNVMDYSLGAGCKVVFVHYRTSERAAFPLPFEDCRQALQFVWEHSAQLGIDPDRIAVGGDSAGGALAAACALWARDHGGPRLCFQMLIYPVTDARMQTPSMKQFTDCPCWNARLNRKMWQLYLRSGWGGLRAYASPMEAEDFGGLPDAYVEVEEFDCLRDEGAAYAEALARAGSSVQLERVTGTFHGFDVFRNSPPARAQIAARIRALRRAFAAPVPEKDAAGHAPAPVTTA